MTDKEHSASIDKKRLVRDLQALGLGRDHWVAVHSSMKSIGWVEGGPQTVIEALIETVGDRGGVMIPLFTLARVENIDLAVTPSYLGLLPETFRRFPGVVRSANPTHSVGIYGPGAAGIAEAHRRTSFIGRGSPWDHLAGLDGRVLHIGTNFNTSSILHLAEVYAQVPYLDVPYPAWENGVGARHTDGSRLYCPPSEVPGDSVMFYLVQEEMDRRGLLRIGQVGQADSVLARAKDLLAVGVEMLRADPAVLLCHAEDCRVCTPSRRLLEKIMKEKTGSGGS
ncbi:MAG: AAC(3) family N-acetyltransferase [Candidatus Glassbacteria bacterium]